MFNKIKSLFKRNVTEIRQLTIKETEIYKIRLERDQVFDNILTRKGRLNRGMELAELGINRPHSTPWYIQSQRDEIEKLEARLRVLRDKLIDLGAEHSEFEYLEEDYRPEISG